MNIYSEVRGDLIKLAKEGHFDVITHGCNCLSNMGSGIAPQMAEAFGCNVFQKELIGPDINKLGSIDYQMVSIMEKGGKLRIFNPLNNRLCFSIKEWKNKKDLFVVNSYTQHRYGRKYGPPIDYEALTLCMRKINEIFKNKHIGLPKIGAGLAGGDWKKIKHIILKELKDCQVTVVIYEK